MNWSFWSDEERWFIPRRLGLGYSLNLKYLVKRLGWIKPNPGGSGVQEDLGAAGLPTKGEETREERLRRQIEASKYEEKE